MEKTPMIDTEVGQRQTHKWVGLDEQERCTLSILSWPGFEENTVWGHLKYFLPRNSSFLFWQESSDQGKVLLKSPQSITSTLHGAREYSWGLIVLVPPTGVTSTYACRTDQFLRTLCLGKVPLPRMWTESWVPCCACKRSVTKKLHTATWSTPLFPWRKYDYVLFKINFIVCFTCQMPPLFFICHLIILVGLVNRTWAICDNLPHSLPAVHLWLLLADFHP